MNHFVLITCIIHVNVAFKISWLLMLEDSLK